MSERSSSNAARRPDSKPENRFQLPPPPQHSDPIVVSAKAFTSWLEAELEGLEQRFHAFRTRRSMAGTSARS